MSRRSTPRAVRRRPAPRRRSRTPSLADTSSWWVSTSAAARRKPWPPGSRMPRLRSFRRRWSELGVDALVKAIRGEKVEFADRLRGRPGHQGQHGQVQVGRPGAGGTPALALPRPDANQRAQFHLQSAHVEVKRFSENPFTGAKAKVMMEKSPSINDVARMAGVSPALSRTC